MSEVMTISGVRGYLDANGIAYIHSEDAARGLGFVQKQIKGGKEYEFIRWNRINDYLKEFGYDSPAREGDYISESVFYFLAFKAKNKVAKAFQSIVATKILPELRKHALLSQILSNPAALATMLGITDFESAKKCAYVLEMDNGTVKIGVTQDFDRRIKEIMNGSGMEIFRSYQTEQMNSKTAFEVEKAGHKTFADKRKRGEFFKVEFDDACAALREYSELTRLEMTK